MKSMHICINCMQEIPEGTKQCPHCGFDQESYKPQASALIPYSILNGRYLIGRALGAGGFGITYLAMDLVLSRKVCVKEFFLKGSMFRNSTASTVVSTVADSEASTYMLKASKDKFEQEAKTLAQLEHVPGIVGVQDYFNENNTSYIVMEYLEGMTLKEYVRQQRVGRLESEEALNKLHPVIQSLVVLHKKGILHRDISPDNIMVLKDGSLKLFDFGGARIERNSGQQSMVIFRKPGYSPVEQYGSEGQGTWSDVYAMAATLYFCLTGKAPVESIHRVGTEEDPLETFEQLNIRVPKQVEEAIYKGLKVNRRDRYQQMEDLEQDLYQKKSPEPKPRKLNPLLLIIPVLLVGITVSFLLRSSYIRTKTGKPADGETASGVEISATKNTEKPVERETEKPAEVPAERVTESPVETQSEHVTEVSAETQSERVTEKPAEEPAVLESEKPAEEPAVLESEKPAEKPVVLETEKPAEKPVVLETEKPAEVQTERIVLLEAEQSEGTYRVSDSGVIIWTTPEPYTSDEESLRHIEEAVPYEVPAGCLFAVDKAATFQFDKWYHTDYYGINGWIKWNGTCDRISKENITVHSDDNVLLSGTESGVPIGNEAGQQDNFNAMLPSGTIANIKDIKQGWGFILSGQNTRGWVNMNNVRPMISNAIYRVSDNVGQTLMLTETTPEADPLTEIPGGTTLYVSDIQNGYGKTAYSGMTGWVRMSDLSLMGDETEISMNGLEIPGEEISVPQGDWHNNLLKEEHGAEGEKKSDGSWPDAKKTVFGVDAWIREQILGIAVQDTLEGVPENAVDISQEGNGSVKGWLDDSGTLHIAGNGGVMAPVDSAALFAHMENVRSIDLRGLHTDSTYDLSFLFYHCDNLETVNLEGIVTDNVTDFTRMFTGCGALRSVDLTGFNTQKVVSFAAMFQNCSSVQELDLTTFNTGSATSFWMMFRGCSNLRSIYWNPRFFVTDNVTNMALMFYDCSALSYVDTSEFNLINVKDMDSAFFNCYALTGLDTSGWNMNNAEDIAHLFGNCTSLTWIDTSRWNLKPNVDRTEIFIGSGLEKYGPNGETLFG